MISTGTLLRMLGAAILLIVVQFASVATQAHVGHSHAPDGHSLQAHGAAVGVFQSKSSEDTGSAHRVARAQSAAQAEAAAQNPQGAALIYKSCAIGCCGTGMGCCGAALATASPDLPPKVGSLRIGFARLVSIREVDPRGLRRPPRFPA
jgi:hypothetical protein